MSGKIENVDRHVWPADRYPFFGQLWKKSTLGEYEEVIRRQRLPKPEPVVTTPADASDLKRKGSELDADEMTWYDGMKSLADKRASPWFPDWFDAMTHAVFPHQCSDMRLKKKPRVEPTWTVGGD